MEWQFWLLGAVVLCLFILAARAAAKKARERRDALAAMAARRGWRFSPGRYPSISSQLDEFAAFQRGESRMGYNTMQGDLSINGRQFDLMAGDFTYKVTGSDGETSNTTTYVFSYVAIDFPFRQVPNLLIRRETVMDKISTAIGMADINFESAEFNQAFYVKGPDRKFAFSVIHPQMIEFLLAGDPPPIELRSGRILFGRGGNDSWSLEEWERQLKFVTKFFELWPQFLLDDFEARS